MRFNQKGFSIVEVLIAGALTSIVALGAAFVISSAQNQSTRANLQNEIDRIQYLNLQLARNITNIQVLYGLDSSSPSDVAYCLQNASVNITDKSKTCNTIVPSFALVSNQQYPNTVPQAFPRLMGPSSQGIEKDIVSTVTVTPQCDPTFCSAIVINVSTEYTGTTGGSFQKRTSTSTLPNYFFVTDANIDFSGCPTPGQIMIGVDFKTNTPICTTISSPALGSTGSSGGLPIQIFDSGSSNLFQVVSAINCPNGYAYGGLFNGESACNDPTKIVTPPPTTAPTPTTLNSGSNCHWKQSGTGYVSRPANTTTCNASNSTSPTLGNQCNCGSYANYCQNPDPTGPTDTYTYFYCDY